MNTVTKGIEQANQARVGTRRGADPMRFFERLFRAILALIVTLIVGVIGFVWTEDLTVFEALWMTTESVMTIGYGDYYPRTVSGKIFAMVYIPLGIGMMTYGLGLLAVALFEGEFRKTVGRRRMYKMIDKLENHIIICGLGRVGRQVLAQLKQENVPFVVIDAKSLEHEPALQNGLYIEGDATLDEVLHSAGIMRASGLVATLPQDADNVFVTLTARGISDSIQIVARAEREQSEEKLRRAGANKVINPYHIGGRKIAMTILKPISVDYVDTILHAEHEDFGVEEIVVMEASPVLGKSLSELNVRDKFGVTILAIKREDTILGNPLPSERLQAFDLVIVFGTKEQLYAFERALKAT